MNFLKNFKLYFILILSSFCFFHFCTLSAEDAGCEIDLFNERGFLKGNTYTSEASGECISDFNGNLTYTKTLLYFPGRGDLDLNLTLTYNGSVNHTIQYTLQNQIVTMNFPECILGVNGVAIQVFNFKQYWYELAAHDTMPAYLVEGYDKSNTLRINNWPICFLMSDGSIEEYVPKTFGEPSGKYISAQVENFSVAWQEYNELYYNRTFKIRRENGIVITYVERTPSPFDRPGGYPDSDNRLPHTYYPISIEDRFGNSIRFKYDTTWALPSHGWGKWRIDSIIDPCGRKIDINLHGVTNPSLYCDIKPNTYTGSGDWQISIELKEDPNYGGGDDAMCYLVKEIVEKTDDSQSRITTFDYETYVRRIKSINPSYLNQQYRVWARKLKKITHSTGDTTKFSYIEADDTLQIWEHLTEDTTNYWSVTFTSTGREPFIVNMVDTMLKKNSDGDIERKVSFNYTWSEEATGYKARNDVDYEYYTVKKDSGSVGLRPEGEGYTLSRKDSLFFRKYPINDHSVPTPFLQHYLWHTKIFRKVNKDVWHWTGYYWDADLQGGGYYEGTFLPDSIRRTRGANRRFKDSYLYDSYGNVTEHIDPLGNEFYYEYHHLDQTNQGNEYDYYVVDKVKKEWVSADSSYGVKRYKYLREYYGPYPRFRLIKKIVKINDSNRDTTKYDMHDIYGNCRRITDAEGNITKFSYNDTTVGETYYSGNHGFWTKKTILDNPLIRFLNDHGNSSKPGLLIKSRDPNGQITRYTKYDWWGRIKEIEKPDDSTPSVKFFYGDQAGNIWSEIWRYYTGSNYYTTLYRFDDFDRVFQKNNIDISTDTLCTEYTHTFIDKVASETSPKGTKTSISDYDYTKYYKYDAIGRLKEVIQPFEVPPTRGTRGYSGTDTLKTLYNYSVLSSDFSYTIDGNNVTLKFAEKTRITDPRGKNKYFIYDAKGQLRAVIEVNGSNYDTTFYDYDPRGLLTATKDAKDREVTFSYNLRGNLIERDHFDLDTSETYEYDKNSRLIKKMKANRKLLSYQYDDISRVTSIAYGGCGEKDTIENFEYTFYWISDPSGRCFKIDSLHYKGSYSMIVYVFEDSALTKAYKIQAKAEQWDWSDYDSLTLYYKFTKDEPPERECGLIVSVKDGSGHSIHKSVDQNDKNWHRLSLSLNQGNLDKSDIDTIGVLLICGHTKGGLDSNNKYFSRVEVDTLGGCIDFMVLKSEKVTKVTFDYDSYDGGVTPPTGLNYPKNQLTKMTDESGWTMYFYDKRRRLGEKWIHFTSILSDTFKVHYTYNKADQITSITYPDDVTASYQYDKFGRTKNLTALLATLAAITYDANSRDSIIDYGIGVESKFHYYPTDWIKSINSTHTMLGTLINNTYEYDSTGNRKTDKESGSLAASYTYDDLNRLTNEYHVTGGWNIDYKYDAVGNRDSVGDVDYTYYTGTNRLKTVGNVTYYYDENGNITGLSNGTSIEYNYRDLPSKIILGSGPTYTFLYNGDGLRVKKHIQDSDRGSGEQGYKEKYKDHTYLHPLGDKHDNARDMGNLEIHLSPKFLKIEVYFGYIYESQGDLENLYISLDTDQISGSGNIYYPDSLYTKVTPEAAWEYCIYVKDLDDFGIFDKYGNQYENPQGMTVQYTGGGPNQRVKIKIPSKLIGNPSSYLITMLTTMPGFENGTDSRATDVVSGDSLGLQDNTIIEPLGGTPSPSENYYFVRDESGNVLCDIDVNGNIKAKYFYVNGKHIAKSEGITKYYYHLDPLGSPLVITKEWFFPSVVKQYKYKAFGELKTQSGTYYDNHKFTGKEEDGTGLYYYGARYYDKSIGRWITIDPASLPSDLNLNDPQSLNPYVYCINNPLKYIDPDGRRIFWKGTNKVATETEKYEGSLEILILSIEQKGLTLPFYYKRGFWDFARKGQQTGGPGSQWFGPTIKGEKRDYPFLMMNIGASKLPIQAVNVVKTGDKTEEAGERILELRAGTGFQMWAIKYHGTIDQLNEMLKEEDYKITHDERYDTYSIEKIDREAQ